MMAKNGLKINFWFLPTVYWAYAICMAIKRKPKGVLTISVNKGNYIIYWIW